MHALLLLLIAFAPPQEELKEVLIQRTEKDPYLAAVRELDRAVELIESEPREAVAKVTSVLGNSKLTKFEVKLKVEIRKAEYERYVFIPYQTRGRAYLALAKRASDPKIAKPSWESAVADLQKSTDAKAPKSAEYLKEAKEGLANCQKAIDAENTTDPAVEFRRKHFDPAIADNKFKTAFGYVDAAEGKDLPDEEKAKFKAEAERNCATFVERQVNNLRGLLTDVTARALRETSSSTFERQYERLVPPEAEVTAAAGQDPTLGWVRRHIRTLKTVQANKAKPEELFAAAHEALAMDSADAEGDNFWFRTMALLASQLIEETLTDRASKSATSRKDVRSRLKEEFDKAQASWKEFVEKSGPKVMARHSEVADRTGKLEEVASGFAVEIPELATFDILKCFYEDPAKTLPTLERGLLDLESKLPARVAIESRQELYTKIVKAGALRRIIEGKPEAEVIQEVRRLVGPKLKDAGGAIDPGEFGPKVKRVIEGL